MIPKPVVGRGPSSAMRAGIAILALLAAAKLGDEFHRLVWGLPENLGAVDLVMKPVEREDLLRVLWRNLVRRQGARVLVVDDEKRYREAISEYLEDVGLEVQTANDGAEALDAVNREAPDAIILDLVMPDIDGMGVLQKLREMERALPVIVEAPLAEVQFASASEVPVDLVGRRADIAANLEACLTLFRSGPLDHDDRADLAVIFAGCLD